VMADEVADVRIVFKNNNVLFQMSSSRFRVTILTASMLRIENRAPIVSSTRRLLP
jgi:hypothetical protein